VRIWIDTDIGSDVDDALALGYVLRHPGFELVGVSTVFGDVALRTRIAEALLEKADAPDVPVVTGLGKPLTERRNGVMFGHEGEGIVEAPAPAMRTEAEAGAPVRREALARALDAARPDVVLAIGPLTNLGALAADGVPLPPLAIMGGKLEDVMLEGMVPQISEWNWWCDPLAVQNVLAAPRDVLPRVVPAEVTFRTELAPGDVGRLAGGDALACALAALCEVWLTVQVERFNSKRPRVALHDPLTAAVLVEPGLCPFATRCIQVDDHGAAHSAPGAPNVEAATDVDVAALRQHLMQTWLPAIGSTPSGA
jgi:purine nucleosidase